MKLLVCFLELCLSSPYRPASLNSVLHNSTLSSPPTSLCFSNLHDSAFLFSITWPLRPQPSCLSGSQSLASVSNQSASWLSLSILHRCCSSLPPYMPSPSPWQLAPWGAAWYPAGHTHRKLPGVFSQRPRSHGGGTRWHSSTSAGTNRVAGAGADTQPPPLPQTAWCWGGGRGGDGRGGVRLGQGPG